MFKIIEKGVKFLMWPKGKSPSEETRKKISKILKEKYATGEVIHQFKGKHHTEETKRKLSESLKEAYKTGKHKPVIGLKGKDNPMYGKKHSEESIRKMSETKKGKHYSEETQRKKSETMKKLYATGKMIPSMLGKHPSEETRHKMSLSRSKEKHPLWCKHHSAETKRKLSMIRKEGYATGRIIPIWKGKHLSGETRKKISESLKGEKHPYYGKHLPLKHRHNQSISARRNWKNEEFAKKRIKSFGIKPNKLELHLNSLLQDNFPNEWKYVGDGQVVINGLCPDFININGKKKIIELFGKFWHDGEVATKGISGHRTEAGKKQVFGEVGYDALIIWDYEFKNEKKMLNKISKFSG